VPAAAVSPESVLAELEAPPHTSIAIVHDLARAAAQRPALGSELREALLRGAESPRRELAIARLAYAEAQLGGDRIVGREHIEAPRDLLGLGRDPAAMPAAPPPSASPSPPPSASAAPRRARRERARATGAQTLVLGGARDAPFVEQPPL